MLTSDIAIEIEMPRVLIPRALVACQDFDVDDMVPPELGER